MWLILYPHLYPWSVSVQSGNLIWNRMTSSGRESALLIYLRYFNKPPEDLPETPDRITHKHSSLSNPEHGIICPTCAVVAMVDRTPMWRSENTASTPLILPGADAKQPGLRMLAVYRHCLTFADDFHRNSLPKASHVQQTRRFPSPPRPGGPADRYPRV